MQENSILNFIGELINAGLRESFAGGSVEKIFLDEETMKLSITARFDRYIEDKLILSAQNEIKNALEINKVVIEPRYHHSAFSDKCAPQLMRALKENIAAANGFVENAKFSFSENSLEITVFNGADILNEAGAKEFLTKFIKETFDIHAAVAIKGEGGAPKLDSPEYKQMQADNIKIEMPVAEEEKSRRRQSRNMTICPFRSQMPRLSTATKSNQSPCL
jgi:hypothetical protein